MCGIAGSLGARYGAAARVAALVQHMTCRGPDGSGFWESTGTGAPVVLGHARLRVVDLSEASRQPMTDPTGRVIITYNGEVYNYRDLMPQLSAAGWRFRSSGDTEVVLAAYATWGEDAWERLEGMFAIIVVDMNNQRLHLVRSRFGSKPLHYAKAGDAWWYASTGDSLAAALGLDIDVGALASGVHTWAYDGSHSRSLFQGVERVDPGTSVSWPLSAASSSPTVRRWYDLADAVARVDVPSTPEDAAREVTVRLESAVVARLHADVGVGVQLSGGLDSGSIAALTALRSNGPLRAYSYRSKDSDPEVPAIRALLARLPGRPSVTWVEPPSAAAMDQTMEAAMGAHGGPPGSMSVISEQLVFRAARSDGCVVMLSGQGADEVFGGYLKYRAVYARSAAAGGHLGAAFAAGAGLGISLAADLGSACSTYAGAARYFGHGRHTKSVFGFSEGTRAPLHDFEALSMADMTWLSLPTLLQIQDRNSMAESVECRTPFLDRHLVELGLALPAEWKIRHSWGKWILRKAMSPLLPRRIAWSPVKRGFATDNAIWLDRGAGAWLRERISDGGNLLDGVDGDLALEPARYSDSVLLRSHQRLHEALAVAWLVTWRADQGGPRIPRPSA